MVSTTVIVCVIVTAVAVAVALYMSKKNKKDDPNANPNGWTDAQRQEIRDDLKDEQHPEIAAIIAPCIIDYIVKHFSYDDFNHKKDDVMRDALIHGECLGKKGAWDPKLKTYFITMISTKLQMPCATCVINEAEKHLSPDQLFPPDQTNNVYMREIVKAAMSCQKACMGH